MTIFNKLGPPGKAICWLNELPDISYAHIETLTASFPCQSQETGEKKSVCLEYSGITRLPGYGLLGTEFLPEHSDQVEVKIFVSKDREKPFKSPLMGSSGWIHIGIPKIYADAILQSATAILQQISWPAGNLLFRIGAHHVMDSSPLIYAKLTQMLMNIVMKDFRILTRPEIEKIIAADIRKDNST